MFTSVLVRFMKNRAYSVIKVCIIIFNSSRKSLKENSNSKMRQKIWTKIIENYLEKNLWKISKKIRKKIFERKFTRSKNLLKSYWCLFGESLKKIRIENRDRIFEQKSSKTIWRKICKTILQENPGKIIRKKIHKDTIK